MQLRVLPLLNIALLCLQIRTLSIVLFRRLLSFTDESQTLSQSMSREVFEQLRADLLQMVKLNCEPMLKKKICDAVAECAKISIGAKCDLVSDLVSDLVAGLVFNYIRQLRLTSLTCSLLSDENGVNTWPEFLSALFECVNSSEPLLRECALNMFA